MEETKDYKVVDLDRRKAFLSDDLKDSDGESLIFKINNDIVKVSNYLRFERAMCNEENLFDGEGTPLYVGDIIKLNKDVEEYWIIDNDEEGEYSLIDCDKFGKAIHNSLPLNTEFVGDESVFYSELCLVD